MNRLKQLRNEKRLTLRELAPLVNISFPNLSAMENGKIGISNDNIDIFCKFYHVSSDYLLGLTDIRNPIKKSDNFVLGGLENELDDEEKQQVLDFATYLVHNKRGGV